MAKAFEPYEEKLVASEFVDLPASVLDATFDASSITAESVHAELLGPRAVVLHGVFSPSECQRVMAFFDSLGISEKCMSRLDYRNNYRAVVKNDAVSAELFRRIKALLPETEVVDESNRATFTSNGIGMNGVWRLAGLNNCFRLCKYDPDGHFSPHYDSDYVESLDRRSFKTFMIYLNDDFSDGETNFLHSHQLHFNAEKKRFEAPPSAVFASLKAKPGDLLIFDHHLLHEGATVRGAQKYIMRSEVMYERDATDFDAMSEEEQTAVRKERRAVELLLKAQALEAERRELEAVEFYRAAFKLCPRLERDA